MCYFYIYNHRGFGWAFACAQSRPCLHWLCTKGILYRSGWASQVLFITYTIIKGLVGPVLLHDLDHAFTGCVQKEIVLVRLDVTGVIYYIYNQ